MNSPSAVAAHLVLLTTLTGPHQQSITVGPGSERIERDWQKSLHRWSSNTD